VSAIDRAPLLLALALTTLAPLAHGDEPSPAQSLFDAALAEMEAGQWDSACAKLAESDRLEASGGTALNLGYCLEHQGHLGRAYEAYLLAAEHYEASHKPERRKAARERADTLRGRVTVVRLAGDRSNVEALVLDGDARPATTDALTVDRGAHVLVVRRGGDANELHFDADAPDLVVTLPARAVSPAGPIVLAPVPPPAPPPPAAPRRTAVWIGLGASLGLAALGAVTGAFALEREQASDAACPEGRCTADGVAAHDAARGLAIATDVLLGTAVVGLAVTAILFFTTRAPRTVGSSGLVLRF
jgi:hypothetical protein